MVTGTEQATEQAVSEPARLFAEERHWSEQRSRAATAATKAEGAAGAALLVGGKLPEQARRLADLRASVAAADAAVAEARRWRVKAILAVWASEAEGLRREAKELVAEAETRQKKTDRLMAALVDWENCEYTPKPPAQAPIYGNFAGSGGAPTIVIVPTPKTELFRQRAADLEEQAARLEARTVPMRGAVEAQDRDEVLRQVGAWDHMKVAPTAAAVEAWLTEAEAPVLERRSRLNTSAVGHGAPLAYAMTWADGEIDTSRSRVTIPVLDA